MGLGKTVICLSLVVANPPPKHNQILPREHIATIDHPSYTKPPCVVGCTSSSAKNKFLSNGSLVIAPMTLCSQWQSEIERFAPWMSILTLHSGETPKVEEIASKDIVVVSTFALQNSSTEILKKLKKVHFHRIFLDESHYNQSGHRTKQSLAALSATYRYCVTGTPIGHSLDDLHGQVRTILLAMKSGPFSAFGIGTSFSHTVSPRLASLPSYSSILQSGVLEEKCRDSIL
jgi:SNF2 family DNA or RNA helicase